MENEDKNWLSPGDTLFLLADKDRFLSLLWAVAILLTSLQELLVHLLAVVLRLVRLTGGLLHQLLVSHRADCVRDIPPHHIIIMTLL